jgi:ABC-type glycerol-3-phosphate transport system permease component
MNDVAVTAQTRRSAVRATLESIVLYTVATAIALVFVYPFYWMFVSAFRSQEAILSAPLRLIPEHLDMTAFQTIASIGGTALSSFAFNSVVSNGYRRLRNRPGSLRSLPEPAAPSFHNC